MDKKLFLSIKIKFLILFRYLFKIIHLIQLKPIMAFD